jgi:hypothetical protein
MVRTVIFGAGGLINSRVAFTPFVERFKIDALTTAPSAATATGIATFVAT